MSFQIETKTLQWLIDLKIVGQADYKQLATSNFEIKEQTAKLFQNGIKEAIIIQQIYKKNGLPIPNTLNHLKISNQPAAQLFNWNVINQALKKIDKEIDPQTKNMIVNGDREHLVFFLRQLQEWYFENHDEYEDSLETEEFKRKTKQNKNISQPIDSLKESLTLSRSEEPAMIVPFGKKPSQLEKMRKIQAPLKNAMPITPSTPSQGDLLQYVVQELMDCIKLSRKQAIALLSDNNKYLAHVFVLGVKGDFTQIQKLMSKWFQSVDFIVQKMTQQNDMCFFFLQVIKPSLLSKSEEIAQWGCRILSRIAHQLANRDMLPLAYDWFVRQAGGLATTILALSRHPKLNQHMVGFILQFARFNVAELFTVQLKKITSNDQLAYIKFILLIFDPLVSSQVSSEELLNSGAVDYWIESSLKASQNSLQNNIEIRLYSIEFLTKLWRAYPHHIEQTLDKVNDIMTYIKRGIRETSQIMRYTLLQLLFSLLDEFASKKNPYASIVYKKITFLFIQNHQELNIREFMLRNFAYIISKYQSIPVDIFLEPFVKQIKIRQSQSYILNIFDMEFINIAVNHRKLKVEVALELFDLLAKTKLNNYQFAIFADHAMDVLLNRFLQEEIFLQYTSKLVKISLAIFYSTFKHKKNQKNMSDQERLHAQKRAEIVNFIISLIQRGSSELNDNIKEFVVHLKIEIQNKLHTTHRGLEKILEMFPNIEKDIDIALEKAMQKEEVESNMTSQNSKDGFKFPKLDQKYLSKDRDQVASQQSSLSQGTRYSKSSRAEFPQKDYTKFAEQDEKKFLKEHGIGFKKKPIRSRKPVAEEVDPKVQQQLIKTKLRKEQEERRREEEKQKIQKRKELLKVKIQKQLEQRNLAQGVKGFEKDVEVKVIFDEGEINQKLIDDDDLLKQINIAAEQNRDSDSIKLILKKYTPFLKKLFSKFASAKVNKKDYFDDQSEQMAQVDLLRLCKEKNIEKNKQIIIELLKQSNDKNIKSVNLQGFFRFIETLTIYLFLKDKCSTHMPMGSYLKQLLKKMSLGQNYKLEEDEDQTTRSLTQKVRYNPHIELPENYKKIYQRVFEPFKECSFPIKKALGNQSLTTCYEVVNEMLYDIFKFQIIQEEVRFFEEARVIKKHVITMPPRPVKKEKQEPVSLLEDKQTAPHFKKRAASNVNKTAVNRVNATNISTQREKQNSRPKAKILNAAERKKIQEEEANRMKKQKEQQEFKRRQQQIKRRFEKMQEEKQKQKSRLKEDKKAAREQEDEKKRRQKEEKERYQKQQKEKLERYKKEKDQKEKEEKMKEKSLRQKEEQQRKEKLKLQMKRQEEKRKDEADKMRRDRQLSEQNKRKKKQEEEKKKQALKKQVLKKLEGEKEKYQIQKLYKELMRKIYQEQDIQNIFNDYKEELKSMYNYGKEYNEYKLGETQNALEQKGWITLCQQFNLCDVTTANNLLKQNQKQKGRSGFLYQDFLQVLLSLGVKRDIENDLDDYDKAHEASVIKLERYMKSLKIPKDKQTMKEYFVGLKNNIKKKEEIQVIAPGGEKQSWQVQE